MLLPGAVLDTLLFLRTLPMFVAPPLSMLLPIILVVPLLLLSVFFLSLLIVPLLLLSVLFLVLPVVALFWLSMLLLLVLIVALLLLLSVLLLGFGLLVLTLLLLVVVLLFVLRLVLRRGRSSDSKKQRQNGRAGDLNWIHSCYLSSFQDGVRWLAQASSCRVDRVTDGFARYKKLHSPVLLPAGGVIVGGYRQGVTEAPG